MIDAEGLPMACAYCLLVAEEAAYGPNRITYGDSAGHGYEIEVTSAGQLVPLLDGRRVFTIRAAGGTASGTTTGMPATVVNGTWVCALHVRESIGGRPQP